MLKNWWYRDFEEAVEVVLEHEGGYTTIDEPTKYGITQTFLENINYPDPDQTTVKSLTRQQAKNLYYQFFWKKYRIDQLPHKQVRIKTLDLAVNIGPKKAIQLLQISVNQCRKVEPLQVDGIIGPETLAMVGVCNEETLIRMFINQAVHYYNGLVNDQPHLNKYIQGWIQRARWPHNGRT